MRYVEGVQAEALKQEIIVIDMIIFFILRLYVGAIHELPLQD